MVLRLLAIVCLYGGGLTCAVIAVRSEILREDGRYQVAVPLWMMLSTWFFLWTHGFDLAIIMALLGAGGIWAIPVASLMASAVLRLRSWALGDKTMPLDPTFDRAEAAERRGDVEGALTLYREAAMRDPGNAEARRRFGEAWLKVGDIDQALAELRAALGLTEDPDKKLLAAFRVVDLLVTRKQDMFNAGLILQEIERDYRGTRVAELARGRRLSLGA